MKYAPLPTWNVKQLKALSTCAFGETYAKRRYSYQCQCPGCGIDKTTDRLDEAVKFYVEHLRHNHANIKTRRVGSVQEQSEAEIRLEDRYALIVSRLREAGTMTTDEVAALFEIHPGTARRNLLTLEGRGIVERAEPGGDGRGHVTRWRLVARKRSVTTK